MESRLLRGSIALTLVDGADHFSETDKRLIKFHGTYQQEDRDARKDTPARRALGKPYMFMVRCKIPGGKVTADQYLAVDRLAGPIRQRHPAHHHRGRASSSTAC